MSDHHDDDSGFFGDWDAAHRSARHARAYEQRLVGQDVTAIEEPDSLGGPVGPVGPVGPEGSGGLEPETVDPSQPTVSVRSGWHRTRGHSSEETLSHDPGHNSGHVGGREGGTRSKPGRGKIPILVALFWASVVAVPVSSALVTAVLSRRVAPGELSVITAVFVLTLIGAVVPIAVQSEVAASRVATGRLHDLPWRGLIVSTGVAALIGMTFAPALNLPPLAVFIGILQILPGVAVGLSRGEMIADRDFGAAALNQLSEAALRLFFGVALGLAFGATGVAASFFLAMLGAWAVITRRSTDHEPRSVLALPATLAGLALFTLSVHLDLVVGPRILGSLADAYSVAALPAKGVFLLLAAAGWVVIPYARSRRTARALVIPVALTAVTGVALAVTASLGAPLVAAVLDRPAPDRAIVLLLGLAMAAASGTWVGLQVLLTRASPRLWVPAATAIGVSLGLAVYTSTLAGFAIAACVGQGAALAVTIQHLRRLAIEEPELDAETAEARFTSPLIAHAEHEKRVRQDLGPACDRRVLGAGSLALMALTIVQRPGTIVSETKLDVVVDPGSFLSRIWNLWEPVADMGRVQNQAVGYMFPMGPFFFLTDTMGIPEWIAIRLWMGLLVGVAFWGAARLADQLRIGVPLTRVLAAAAYALSPMVIARVGNTSGIMIGLAFLPWVVLPLVRASKSGSVRKAAAVSGVAVLCMGGVNGAITLATLVVPAMYLVSRRPGPRRRALMGWWLVCVALATFWWFVPLIFQAKYGFNFLPFTERAATTTAFASPVEALRGTGDWLSYLNLGEPWLPAGWWLVANPAVIVATALIAGVGLFGLARRDMTERVFLASTLVLGVALVSCGYAAGGVALPDGVLGNPLGGFVRTMLDGAGGIFRNVWKFQPVIALPLALGTAHALALFQVKLASRRKLFRPVVATCAVAVVALSALPILRGDLVTSKGWEATPDYWMQFSQFHEAHTGNGRLLVLPGASTADYSWGRTLDEPLQTSTNVPWAVRSIIPLGGAGSAMVLDTVEGVIQRGGDPALAAFLARAGFTYVVVRNDLDWRTWNAPRPSEVNAALAASGLVKERSFGPSITVEGQDPFGVADTERRLKALEVYKVDPVAASKRTGDRVASSAAAHGLVTSYAADATTVVSGDPGAVLALQRTGLLKDSPVVLAGDQALSPGLDPSRRSRAQIITDSNRNVWSDHGLVRDKESYALAQGEKVADEREANELLATSKEAPRTYAVQDGIAGVTASSYGSWLFQIPEAAPANALDGDPGTVWVAGPTRTSVGEWFELDLGAETDVEHVDLRLLADGPWRTTIRELEVSTDAGRRTVAVQPGELPQRVALPVGSTSKIRLTFTQVENETPTSAGVGIRELVVPGISTTRRLVLPDLPAGSANDRSPTAFVFERSVADPRDVLRRDPESVMHRRFSAPQSQAVTFTGTARPVPGPALFALIDRKGDLGVTASTTYEDHPDYRPSNLLDRNARTIWVALPPEPVIQPLTALPGQDARRGGGPARVAPIDQRTDPTPSVTLTWVEKAEISELNAIPAPNFSAPTELSVTNERGETRTAKVGSGGKVQFAPLAATSLTVRVTKVSWQATSAADGTSVPAPLGLADLEVPALQHLLPGWQGPGAQVTIPCEQGPSVNIDGRPTRFSVETTVGELTSLRPAVIKPCDSGVTQLGAGRHDLDTSLGQAPFNIDSLAVGPSSILTAASGPGSHPAVASAVRGGEWSAEHRTIDVGPGAASVVVVSENFANGWKATFDGKDLSPVQVDGWRQGFAVPASNGGAIELDYLPSGAYRLALLVGLAFMLALVLLALAPARVDRSLVAFDELAPRSMNATVAAVALIATAVWLGGLAGLILCPLVLVVHRRMREATPVLVLAGMVLAGLFVAVSPGSHPAEHAGAFGWPAQLLAVGVILLITASLLAGARPEAPPPELSIDLRDKQQRETPSFAFPERVPEPVPAGVVRQVPEWITQFARRAHSFANPPTPRLAGPGTPRAAARSIAVVRCLRSFRSFLERWKRNASRSVPRSVPRSVGSGFSPAAPSSAAAPAVLFPDVEAEQSRSTSTGRRRRLKALGGRRRT